MARDLNWSHLIICTISSASHKILYIIVNNKRAATKSKNAANLPEEVHLTIDFLWIMQAYRLRQNNCFMVTWNEINVSWMSVINALKNPVKYHWKWYRKATKLKKKFRENTEAEISLLISNQETTQLTLRKTMWENMTLGIEVISYYVSRMKRAISHLSFSHINLNKC